MLNLVLLCLALSTPFEDPLKRFTIDLPSGWEFAPLPGDTSGTSFRIKRPKSLAFASVRIFPAMPDTTLDSVSKLLAQSSAKETNYKQSAQELTYLAGFPAMRRRYSSNVNKELVKTVEQRFAIVGNRIYVVHVESLQPTFKEFNSDFEKIFSSFKPAASE
jgi:hypothetical protein